MKFNAPMLVPLAGIISGIILMMLNMPLWCALIIALLAGGSYFFITRLSGSPVRSFNLNKYHYIWIFLIFSAIGLLTSHINKFDSLENLDDYLACKGRISQLNQKTNGDNAVIEIHELIKKNGETQHYSNLKLLLKTDYINASIDEIIVFPIKLSKIEDSENYFSQGYSESMAKRGIFYQSYVEGNNIIPRLHSSTFSGVAWETRDRLESLIEKTSLDKKTQNFLITILLGDRSYLQPELRNMFADAGISHILALSGMHIAIIGGIILWILFPLNFYGKYKLRYGITVVILFLYAFITGWNPSTVRAVIMMSAIVLCIILERKNSSWNSLLTAVFIILLFNPSALYDVGLQLSFLCVGSLIFFVRPLNPFDQHDHPVLYNIATAFITTLAVSFGTWVISAYYFGVIPLVFLPANIIVLPFLPLYLAAAIIFILLSSVGINLNWLGDILNYGFTGLSNLIEQVTSGGTSSYTFNPSLLSVILWIILIVFLAFKINGKYKKLSNWSLGIVSLFFILSISFTSEANDKEGFIIQKGIGNVTVLSRTDGSETLHKIERKTISEMKLNGHSILFIDCPVKEEIRCAGSYDEIVISGGFKDSLNSILRNAKANKIIIHPSVRKKREKSLKAEADSLKISHHSIREKGPYRFIQI